MGCFFGFCFFFGQGYWTAANTFKSQWIVFVLVAQIPIGFSVAASVRVGNALGAGCIEQAKLSCKVSLLCACTSQLSGLTKCVHVHRPMAAVLTCATHSIHALLYEQDMSCIASVFLRCFHVVDQHYFHNLPCVRMSVPALFSCLVGVCVGASKDVIGYIFTTDEWVTYKQGLFMCLYIFTLVAKSLDNEQLDTHAIVFICTTFYTADEHWRCQYMSKVNGIM